MENLNPVKVDEFVKIILLRLTLKKHIIVTSLENMGMHHTEEILSMSV